MSGLLVFKSLGDAYKEGYEKYDELKDSYLVRKRFSTGWGLAIVAKGNAPRMPELDDSPYFHFGGDPEC